MKKYTKYLLLFLLVGFLMSLGYEADAQCPMCRMAADSNLKDGGTEGKGLNTGILYILAMPYTLVMVMGYIWYRNKKEVDTEPTS
jgi:hypothetical protein